MIVYVYHKTTYILSIQYKTVYMIFIIQNIKYFDIIIKWFVIIIR